MGKGMGGVELAVREVAGEPYPEPEEASGVVAEVEGEGEEADALDDLGDEIALLAAHIHATTLRFLELVCEFDRRRGWEPAGHRSCADWLAFRTGFRPGTAREYVRVARALERLPLTCRAMARGQLSFCQVRALTRVADAEHEAELVALAEGCTTSRLERMLRAWKKGSRQDEAARERERHRLRRLSVFPDDEGMVVVKGRLMPEVGAVLMKALEAAEDALYRRRGPAGSGSEPGEESTGDDPTGAEGAEEAPLSERAKRRQASRRRADAAGLLAERALAAGSGSASAEEGEELKDVSGSRAERYQVFLHVDHGTLAAEGETGRSLS